MGMGQNSEHSPDPELDESLRTAMPRVYERARALSGMILRGDRARRWVRPSSLVQRTMVKFMEMPNTDPDDEARTTATLATLMRRVMVDIARRRTARKRGAGRHELSLHALRECAGPRSQEPAVDPLELEDALNALAVLDAEGARVAELRIWGGMEFEAIARATDAPLIRVRRCWSRAKAWLAAELGANG